MFKKYTPTWSTKTTQLSRPFEQLTDNVYLAASAQWIYVVWIGGIPQSCTFHTLINLLDTNSFYTHARHQKIRATRHDKNGLLQNVPWSVGRLLSDVTPASCGSPNQPIRCNQKHQRVFLKISSRAENWEASNCWQSAFEVFGQSSWSFVKHCEQFAKLY